MSDFGIQIELDPTQATRGARAVEDAVKKTEDAAKRTQQAYDALGETFRRVASHQALLAREAAKAKQAVDNLASGFGGMARAMTHQGMTAAAKAFDSLTAAIMREQAVLQSIRGPMQQYQQDLTILNKLLGEGRINADEHAAALAKARQRAGVADPIDAVSLPDAPQKPRSMLGRLNDTLGPGLGFAAGAAGAVALGKGLLELGDSYTMLENRLRQVTTSQEGVNGLMDATRGIAERTRTSWDSVNQSFVRMRVATADMGLSLGSTLRLTELVGKAIKTSGADAQQASAGMLQLGQAFSSGRLQGDEFRSVAENIPIVLDLMSKHLGVSRGELRQMASEGKITSQVIADTFLKGGKAIEDGFAKTIPTAAESWQSFKDTMVEFGGELVRTHSVMDLVKREGLLEGATLLERLEQQTKTTTDAFRQGLNRALPTVAELADETNAKMQQLFNTMNKANTSFTITRIAASFVELSNILEKATKQMDQHKEVMELVGIKKTSDFTTSMTNLNEAFGRGDISVEQYNRGLEKLAKGFDTTSKSAENTAKKIREANEQYLNSVFASEIEARRARAAVDVTQSTGAGFASVQASPDLALDVAAATEKNRKANALLSHHEALHKQKQAVSEYQQALNDLGNNTMRDLESAAKSVGDALVDAFTSGEFAADKFFASLGTMLLKGVVNNAIGFGFDQLPKFAEGGYIPPSGGGGVDSQVVAFRKSPWESVAIMNPHQEAAMRSGGGQRRTIVIDMPGGRQARVVTEDDFETLHLRATERNAAAVRSRITGH